MFRQHRILPRVSQEAWNSTLRVDPSMRETPPVPTSKNGPRVMEASAYCPGMLRAGRGKRVHPNCRSGGCLRVALKGIGAPQGGVLRGIIKLCKDGRAPRTRHNLVLILPQVRSGQRGFVKANLVLVSPSVWLTTASDSWEPLLGFSSSCHSLSPDLPPHNPLLGQEAQSQPREEERVDAG